MTTKSENACGATTRAQSRKAPTRAQQFLRACAVEMHFEHLEVNECTTDQTPGLNHMCPLCSGKNIHQVFSTGLWNPNIGMLLRAFVSPKRGPRSLRSRPCGPMLKTWRRGFLSASKTICVHLQAFLFSMFRRTDFYLNRLRLKHCLTLSTTRHCTS